MNLKQSYFKYDFSELVARRFSCRTFENRKIEPAALKPISDFISTRSPADHHSIRLQIIYKKDIKKENLFSTGTYGMIKGVNTFMAGIIEKKHPVAWEELGYVMQQAVILATDLELNTCWIGGVFDRKTFGKVLNIHKNEMIPAIIALGYAASKKTLRNKMTRWGAKGDRRKPAEKLFFHQDIEHPLDHEFIPGYRIPLENVRLAPSASNKQPWRIIRVSDCFHFYLNRDKVYSKLIPRVDLQRIDMGIAMFHFEQSARECGLKFKRIHVDPVLENLPNNYEYIVSYQTQD